VREEHRSLWWGDAVPLVPSHRRPPTLAPHPEFQPYPHPWQADECKREVEASQARAAAAAAKEQQNEAHVVR